MTEKADTDRSRRGFLGFLGAIGLGWLAAALYPVFRYLSPQAPPDPFGEDGRALVEQITHLLLLIPQRPPAIFITFSYLQRL